VRWLYSGDDPLKIYAEWLGISLAKAKRTRDEFYPWEALDPDKIVGLDAIVRDAVTLKYLSAPLTQAQLDELVVKFAP
jgi:NitT/TauT family transport system substrate-binding protein